MKYIIGQNREQMTIFPVSLDSSVSEDNEVRLIDAFVDGLPLEEYGFRLDYGENGRPAYHPSDMLKLYLYGYMNKIRTSRDLEKECNRNIEVIWLLKGLKPDHNTISNFRMDNPEAISKVFQATVTIAKHFKLIGGRLLAGDGTKFRAQNSKKNNYNQKKIDRHIAYIDKNLKEYNDILDSEDGDKETAKKAIAKHEERKEEYQKLEQQLKETGQEQISTSDPESRQLPIRNGITEVSYNTQVTTDSDYNMPIDYEVTNTNDIKAAARMVEKSTKIVNSTDFTMLYDKGYHAGSEIKKIQDMGVDLMIAVPKVSSNAPDSNYNLANFIYNKEQDYYICPQQQVLNTNGTWYTKNRGDHRDTIQVKQYKTKACKSCPVLNKCTKSVKNGRIIERSEYAENIERNRENVENNQHLYRRRQSIVEHPFGTIKRQWGFSYILTKKGIDRASADVGFMFIAYNLRRLINIKGFKQIMEYLLSILRIFSAIRTFLGVFSDHISRFYFRFINIPKNLQMKFFFSIIRKKNVFLVGY
jgi:transposase